MIKKRKGIVEIGARYGSLIILNDVVTSSKHRMVLCQCDCGKTITRSLTRLRNGHATSCGCLKINLVVARNVARSTHGESHNHLTPEYRTWRQMIQRCYNPKAINHGNYGGRGITVCEAWRTSFQQFLTDVGRKPNSKYTIERINNNLGYSKNNVRWATSTEQNRNRRNNRTVKYNGETKTLIEWAESLGLSPEGLSWRIGHWPLSKALTKQVLECKP